MATAFSTLSARSLFAAFYSSSSSFVTKKNLFIVNMVQNQTYWANLDADIETHLKTSIPIRAPLEVFEPMNYVTFAAPRSTAPALCIAACEAVGGERHQAMSAAAAIHLIHAAAYTHQHLPLTDRARPGPTVEHKFEPNIELMTGDGIVPFGFELLARSMDSFPSNSDRILRVIVEISKAAGSQGIVEGQYRELDIDFGQSESDTRLVEHVCKKKEGELHACGAACGAILGGGSEEEIERLRNYGLFVGMIKGLMNGVGRNQKGVKEIVEKLTNLAKKELESLNSINIEAISGLVETEICSV